MIRILIAAGILTLALTGCKSGQDADAAKQAAEQAAQTAPKIDPNMPKLQGDVIISGLTNVEGEGYALRNRLYDVTNPAAKPVLVVEYKQPVEGAMPLKLVLPYASNKVAAGKKYAVDVALTTADTPLYGLHDLVPVASMNGKLPEITLMRAAQFDVNTTPSDKIKNRYRSLEAMLGGMELKNFKRLEGRTGYAGQKFFEDGVLRLVRRKVNFEKAADVESAYAFNKDGSLMFAKQTIGGKTKEWGWDDKGNLVLNTAGDDGAAIKAEAESVYNRHK